MKTIIDFIQGQCFGIQKSPNWVTLLDAYKFSEILKNKQNRLKFETTLSQNINQSYKALALLEFTNLNSNTNYIIYFDSTKKKWIIEIKNSKNAEVSLEEKTELIKNETVTKAIDAAYDKIFGKNAEKYINSIMPKIERGLFLTVDEAKAEALVDFLTDNDLKTAFKSKSFIK